MAQIDTEKLIHQAREGDDVSFPGEIIFEVTYRCNLRCKMCFYAEQHFTHAKEMSLDQIATCVSKIPDTVCRVVLIGGEPLLRRDIVDIVRLFATRNIAVTIATNGYFLKPELVEQLKETGTIDKIAISFDGPPEVHNVIRGPKDAFERSFENIQSASQYFPVEVVSVFQNGNEESLTRLIPYLRKLKNCQFSVEIAREYSLECLKKTAERFGLQADDLHMKPNTGMRSRVSLETMTFQLKRIREKVLLTGFPFHFVPANAISLLPNLVTENWKEPEKQFICTRFYKARLDPQGNLIHCYALRMPFGSLLEHTFEEIWNGKAYKTFRQNLLREGLPPICTHCLACQPDPSRQPVTQVSSPVRFGIIGCGKITVPYINTLRNTPECSLIGVTSRSQERGERFANENNTAYFPLYELVKHVDALVITTEPETHQHFVQEISKHGTRHILLEKPLAVELSDCQQILAHRNQVTNGIWGVSSQMRYSNFIIFIKNLLYEGRIGELRWFSIQCNYNRSEGYYAQGSGWRKQIGGNIIFNQGIHVIDFVWDMFGLPESVRCFGTQVRHQEVPFDTAKIFLRYEENLFGDLLITTAAPQGDPLLKFRIVGTEGEVFISTDAARRIVGTLKKRKELPANMRKNLLLPQRPEENSTNMRGNLPIWNKHFFNRAIRAVGRKVYNYVAPFGEKKKSKPQPQEQWFKWYPQNVHDLQPQIRDFVEAVNGWHQFSISLEDGYHVAVIANAAQQSLVENREVRLQEILNCS